MRERFGKRDLIFIGCIAAACLAVWVFSRMSASGSRIVVTVDGSVYATCSLDKDQTILIRNPNGEVTNTLVIKHQTAYMESADCPDRLCVKQGAISRTHETIVCLPNHVVVTAEGGQDNYDAMVK